MACQGHCILPSDALQSDMMYPGFDEPDCSRHLDTLCQCDMHEDIRLELTPHPHSMRQVVNIIIAVKRLIHTKEMSLGKFCEDSLSSGKLCEDAVVSFILENVIEERHIKPLNVAPTFSKIKQSLQCTVCDKYRKTLVQSNKLTNEDLHLKAVTLNAGTTQYKVQFHMSTYMTTESPKNGQPVCLGIFNSNFYIACTKTGDSAPVLLLKEVSVPLDTIKVGDPNGFDSLLFFRKATGTGYYNTFESVKYPGWFITTAFGDWERVEMHQVPTDRTTDFTLEDQKLIQS